MVDPACISWTEDGTLRSALWLSARGRPAPRAVMVADDRLTADAAFLLASQGTALLWRGDFHNARQMLDALARRLDKRRKGMAQQGAAAFHAYRQAQAQRAALLGLLLVPLSGGEVPLGRAPRLSGAVEQALGPVATPALLPLRDLLGFISAREWRRNGVPVPALSGLGDGKIHPHFGVFPPTRQDYVELVAAAPLPVAARTSGAFDIGTGTGLLAAILAARGVGAIVATDNSPPAVACARENIARLGLSGRVHIEQASFFPEGRAGLVVCNPPWLPGKVASPLESAVYDPESAMLRGFLAGVARHLTPQGEAWLILSDLAELLQLRSRDELTAWMAAGDLQVIERLDAAPTHARARDETDPLHWARRQETTSLWRLAARR